MYLPVAFLTLKQGYSSYAVVHWKPNGVSPAEQVYIGSISRIRFTYGRQELWSKLKV